MLPVYRDGDRILVSPQEACAAATGWWSRPMPAK